MGVSVLLWYVAGLLLCPLFVSAINRTKARYAGRSGAPWLQPYSDLWKLLGKGAVYSTATTWVFRAGPLVGLAAAMLVWLLVPAGGTAPVHFPGDFLLLAYLFGLSRFFTVLAALDTGSAFEGMGAAREVRFALLAEPALLLALLAAGRVAGSSSLSGIHLALTSMALPANHIALLLLVLAVLLIIMLAECSRIPVDDPNTHLELTMVHEVMVLDHGGPELALIEYTSALRLWLYATLLLDLLPWMPAGWGGALLRLAGTAAIAVVVGMIESTMARLRLSRVPQLLVAAMVLALTALILSAR